ncbi:helix-turn-helix domain-containing protein [Frondihabitans australicus]|nr:helix-turn-helix transcriptional regulator [Frondihabitans australicus]
MRPRDQAIRTSMALRLREHRERVGLSPKEAADRAGVALGNYYQLERGDGNPTVTTLVKLARGLGVDPSDLLTGLHP